MRVRAKHMACLATLYQVVAKQNRVLIDTVPGSATRIDACCTQLSGINSRITRQSP